MIPGKQVDKFIEIAESLKPTLTETKEHPQRVIKVEKDENELMGWKAVDTGKVEDVGPLKGGEDVIYDFGGHRAGFFDFDIKSNPWGAEPADAPCRMKIVFGEVLNDVAESFDDYKSVTTP